MGHQHFVGICGRANSGKDTAANHLIRNHNFKPLTFATPIKELLGKVYGFSERQLYGSSFHREQVVDIDWPQASRKLERVGPQWLEELGFAGKMLELFDAHRHLLVSYHEGTSARVILQYMGTEFGREKLKDSVWIDTLVSKANTLLSSGECDGIVVTDVRFANEIHAIKAARGKVIKLLRNANSIIPGIANHKSEAEQDSLSLDTFDVIINNNKSLDDLFSALDTFVNCLGE